MDRMTTGGNPDPSPDHGEWASLAKHFDLLHVAERHRSATISLSRQTNCPVRQPRRAVATVLARHHPSHW